MTDPLTESQQMYLKTAYLIQQEKGAARVTDIARRLGVIKASVTAALRTLAGRGLVNHARYDLISLTDQGKREAAAILGRYEALRSFLVTVLGVDQETADREACLMEHRLSEETHKRLLDFVGSYEGCPRWTSWRAQYGTESAIAAGPRCDECDDAPD